MKSGDLVRHKKMPSWGIGVVVDIALGKCTINFDSAGQKVLQVAIATSFLDAVPPSEAPGESALLDPNRWHELDLPVEDRKKAKPSKATTPCEHCGKPLRRSQYSSDDKLKSCPRCSTNDGKQHVFYDYPAGFGQSEARESEETPDGAQSHCVSCRGRGQERQPRRCAEISR